MPPLSANALEFSPEEMQHHDELLTIILRWLTVLAFVAQVPFLALAIRAPNASNLVSFGEVLLVSFAFLWCRRRVRQGQLKAPTRTVLTFILLGELSFLLFAGHGLRLAGAMGFAIVISLALALEPPRAAFRWIIATTLAYAVGSVLPRLAGLPQRQVELTDEISTGVSMLIMLIVLAFLGRSTVRLLRRALANSEAARKNLERTTARLEEEQATLQSFAYVVSHDLRAPLRALTNYSRFLQEDCAVQLDESGRGYVDNIRESALRMDALIVDLLEYSRIGRVETELADVDVGALLERVVSSLDLREKADVSLPANAPPVRAREVRLEQIFTNLIDNATKFHRPGVRPAVAVECADRGTAWEFSVRDNGIGIDPQHFEKIFGVFQRLHAQDHYEGTGIGLAIVKKAVEEHGGKVWVESTPDQGSTFRLILPNHPVKPG